MSGVELADIYDEAPPERSQRSGKSGGSLTNIEAEQTILGALLAQSATYHPQVRSKLKPAYFSDAAHARIYEVVDALAASGKVVSPVTIKNLLEQEEALSEIGGTTYLVRLVEQIVSPGSLDSYVDIVRDLAARRAAVAAGRRLITRASAVTLEGSIRPAVAEHISDLQRLFDEGSERKTSFTLGEAMLASVDRVKRIRACETDPNAIRTGIAAVDKFTGGMHRGEYIVLGGRPSMGKTALGTQIAYNVAECGGGVFYASLEMPVPLLSPRFAARRLSGPDIAIDYQSIIRGEVDDRTLRWLESAAEELKTWPLIIDDAAGLTPAELEARAQITKAKFERSGTTMSLVVVDHIHKMRHPGAQSKVVEYTEISARLAEMAKRLNCPVLVLAQLNRGVEARDDKRPQLADLRESGSIEQDADTVLFVFRPAYYLERKRCADPGDEEDRLSALEVVKNRLELIIEKQRSGPIGTIDLWCDMALNVVRDPVDFVDMERAA